MVWCGVLFLSVLRYVVAGGGGWAVDRQEDPPSHQSSLVRGGRGQARTVNYSLENISVSQRRNIEHHYFTALVLVHYTKH